MDPAIRRHQLVIRGASLVAIISAWLFDRFREMSSYNRGIYYGSMITRDQEWLNNLRFIYHSDDVHCVDILRMKGLLFLAL
jgi:hypothetical protein